jgi:hypothetical protein
LSPRFLLHHIVLVFKIKKYGGDTGFLQFGYVRQLPPYSPASPADRLNQAIDRLHLLFG